MARATEKDLLQVVKAPKETLDKFAAGVRLVEKTGYSLESLRVKAIRDRIQLAKVFLRDARAAVACTPPMYRTTISRAYYSMYHALRAVSFFHHRGDDHEAHSKLPGAIPADFPDADEWLNDLKSARLERNKADYEPYPKTEQQFQVASEELIENAAKLIPIVMRYLKDKGITR